MENRTVITFDNLRQANSEIAGETQTVKALLPVVEHFSQPNAKGSLYLPNNLDDVSARARATAERFRAMFQ
jgi:hypothetical protein